MRPFIIGAVLIASLFSANSASAQSSASLVDSWYVRYLGRNVDPAGLHDHLQAIRHGTPIDVVEAAILSSPEYFARNGNTPEGFVAALHRDVLGRRAGAFEFSREVNHVITRGRNAVALEVLSERSPAVVARPAPVYVAGGPVVVAPLYRPAPVYVSPRPAISLRFSFGR